MADVKINAAIQGDLAVTRGDGMTSFALSNRYWVGSLPIWMKLAYYVSQRPMMLGVFTLLLALALAGPAYIFFRRQARSASRARTITHDDFAYLQVRCRPAALDRAFDSWGAARSAEAQSAGVEALVKQAQYWRSKGREDLAQQALKRARALDPNNPALKAPAQAPKPAAPKPAPKPVAKPAAAKPAPAPKAAPAPARAAAPKPTPAPTPTPAPVSAADRAGRARVSGFDALNDGNLGSAASQFQRALGVNRRDPDALGGLGLVRLREGQFAEAASLLEQASANGKASQWAEACPLRASSPGWTRPRASSPEPPRRSAEPRRTAGALGLQGTRPGARTAGRHLRASGPLCRRCRPLPSGRAGRHRCRRQAPAIARRAWPCARRCRAR
ncbi:hypothetical protein [Novosphingobium resinovorum]|uniref:hypothetical protein n=1 Tax=Novosphingobium resinovorum TaxID=158500 RepID=UPI003D275B2F